MTLNNDIAYIIGFACELFLYGLYFLLFSVSSALFYRRRNKRSLNTPLIVAHCALFTLASTHFALEFNHFCVYLATYGVDGYANETKKMGGADIIMSLLDFTGDMVLLYRCWLVWGRAYWIVVLPFLTALSGFASAMEMMHLILTLDPTAPHPPPAITPLGTAAYALPLCTNIMVTLLIVGRVWYISRGIPDYVSSGRARQQAMAIVVESGLLYLIVQLIFVVLFTLNNPGCQIAGIIAVQIYGIAPTLILVRVGLGFSDELTTQATTAQTGPMIWATRHTNRSNGLSTTRVTQSIPGNWVFKSDIELSSHKRVESDSATDVAI